MVEPPDEELLIPLGAAEVKREGSDVSIICYAQTVPACARGRGSAREEDIFGGDCLIFAQSNLWMRRRSFNSVSKTHRAVIVEQDRPFCGVGAEVCYRIQKSIFDELDAPIMRVAQRMCRCLTTSG